MRDVQSHTKPGRVLIIRILLGAVLLTGSIIAFSPPLYSTSISKTRTVKVKSVPVNFNLFNKTQTTFGKLLWRGGVEIIGADKDFGGLSGIATGSDGKKFVAVSDKGQWVTGEIQYVNDRLSGVFNVKISPMLDARGRVFEEKSDFDAESVTPFGNRGLNGEFLVAFERKQRIGRYDFGGKGVRAREKTIALPAAANRARRNKEFEAVGRFPTGSRLGGSIIAITERFLDAEGNIIGWLIGGPTPGRFTIKRTDGFDITDLTITPDNELIILERYFSSMIGIKMRLRRINTADVKPGAVLDGEILLQSDRRNTIDNMEGLASHRAANGEVRLTLISDDNFNVFQRTLLLQFALPK